MTKGMYIIITTIHCILCGVHMLSFYFMLKHNQYWYQFVDLIVRNTTVQSDSKLDI
jgi:hypothetical protein